MRKTVVTSTWYYVRILVDTGKGNYEITGEKYYCRVMKCHSWYGEVTNISTGQTAGLDSNDLKREFIQNGIDFIQGVEAGKYSWND